MGSTSSNAAVWLVLWMINNILVTILNKAAFVSVDFHYPYLLSAIHMVCNGIGAYLIFYFLDSHSQQTNPPRRRVRCCFPNMNNNSALTRIIGHIPRKQVTSWREMEIYFAYSIIFSLNIAIGNLSLSHVSVNFNQVMRSLVPAFTIGLSFCLGQPTTGQRILAVVPIVLGVAMATYGDFTFTWLGFSITLLCVFLAAGKVVASGYLLQGNLKLHPVDLLFKMTPFSTAQCLGLAWWMGEFNQLHTQYQVQSTKVSWAYTWMVVVWSGILAFSLNISSLMANKLTSPLTLCIAANVKQVLMMVSSTVIFQTPVSLMNGTGIVIVLIGSAIYSAVSLREEEKTGKMKVDEKSTVMEMIDEDVDVEGQVEDKKPLLQGGSQKRIKIVQETN